LGCRSERMARCCVWVQLLLWNVGMVCVFLCVVCAMGVGMGPWQAVQEFFLEHPHNLIGLRRLLQVAPPRTILESPLSGGRRESHAFSATALLQQPVRPATVSNNTLLPRQIGQPTLQVRQGERYGTSDVSRSILPLRAYIYHYHFSSAYSPEQFPFLYRFKTIHTSEIGVNKSTNFRESCL